MARSRQLALVLVCGTVTIAGWDAARLGGFEWSGIENIATPMWNGGAARGATMSSTEAGLIGALLAHATASASAAIRSHRKVPEPDRATGATMDGDPSPRETAVVRGGVSAPEASAAEAALPNAHPTPPAETSTRLVSLFRPDAPEKEVQPVARPVDIVDECLVVDICIDEYLWSLYERTPKVDTNKVTEQIKTTLKTKRKTRTVTKTITKYVVADFAWKDPIAAQRAGMSLKEYVIGGMDRGFKFKLFRALRMMDDAGFMPGITSAFRDDYRQSIASGNKAASDSSFHGGSRRGGYGYGLAVDLVSVKGETRIQRFASSEELWKWDRHAPDGAWGRASLSRSRPSACRTDRRQGICRQAWPAECEKGRIVSPEGAHPPAEALPCAREIGTFIQSLTSRPAWRHSRGCPY